MKILDKKTVNKQVADERKNQIDEGIALASKIDKLRQTLSELETQHTRFIGGIQSELKEKSDVALREIAQLEVDIASLQEKRRLLRIPLDDEWQKLQIEKESLGELRETLEENIKEVAEKQKKADERYASAKLTVQKINVRERELVKVYDSQEKTLQEIEIRNQKGIEEKERLDQYISDKNQELLSREAEIAVKERVVGMARDTVERDRRELINRTALLVDREQTFERELKRQHS